MVLAFVSSERVVSDQSVWGVGGLRRKDGSSCAKSGERETILYIVLYSGQGADIEKYTFQSKRSASNLTQKN